MASLKTDLHCLIVFLWTHFRSTNKYQAALFLRLQASAPRTLTTLERFLTTVDFFNQGRRKRIIYLLKKYIQESNFELILIHID